MAKMKKLQPRMLQIREQYKDDRQAQQQELMKIYREEKLNPLAGCLPILLQIPVFFALYKVLFVTIDMRHQPFFGWITDLSAPDPTSLFNLFGLIRGIRQASSCSASGRCYGCDHVHPNADEPAAARPDSSAHVPNSADLLHLHSGRISRRLVIYWAWNNFLSILQQGLIMRRNDVEIELLANIGFSGRARKPSGDGTGDGTG